MEKIFHYLNIKATPEKVYAQISDIEQLKKWWTTDTKGQSEEGKVITFGFGNGMHDVMKVIELTQGKKVVWECIDSNFPTGNEWIGTVITFEILKDKDENTILKFSHDKWREMTDFFGVCNYHWGIFMVSLKALCETGKGNPHIVN